VLSRHFTHNIVNECHRLLSTVDSGLPVLLDVENSMIGFIDLPFSPEPWESRLLEQLAP